MKIKSVLLMTGLTALLALGVVCGNSESAETPTTSAAAPMPAAQAASPAVTAPAPPVAAPAPAVAAVAPAPVAAPAQAVAAVAQGAVVDDRAASGVGAQPLPGGSSQAGIWVTGEGSISLEPDLAVINIGVETEAISVAEARDQAARAMDAITAAVKAQGLEDRDVQTRSFNIFPIYDYSERTQRLTGYRVSNSASIKIRDLDKVGEVIDDVADAGGNATRINGISFTVEDTKQFTRDLREQAVADALAKAEHFAELTGVSVGRLAYIAEAGVGAPVVQDFGGVQMERAFAAAAPTTSISGGELELTLRVTAVFGIQ